MRTLLTPCEDRRRAPMGPNGARPAFPPKTDAASPAQGACAPNRSAQGPGAPSSRQHVASAHLASHRWQADSAQDAKNNFLKSQEYSTAGKSLEEGTYTGQTPQFFVAFTLRAVDTPGESPHPHWLDQGQQPLESERKSWKGENQGGESQILFICSYALPK